MNPNTSSLTVNFYLTTYRQYFQRERTEWRFSCPEFPDNCFRWENVCYELLQPWRHYFCRLSGKIYCRVDATHPLLGMQSYDKKSDAAIRKTDVSIAKNYLNEDDTTYWKSLSRHWITRRTNLQEILTGSSGRESVCEAEHTKAIPKLYQSYG